MINRKTILSSLAFILSVNAFAATEPTGALYFRDSSLSINEFKGRVLAESGISFADFLREQRYAEARTLGYISDFEQLKTLEVLKRNRDVFDRCNRITSRRFDFDWPKAERSLISWCLEKLAKSVALPDQNLSLNQESRIFSGQVRPSDLVSVELDDSLIKNVDIFLINGLEVNAVNSNLKVPTGKFRFTMLSGSHHLVTEFIDSAQLRNMKMTGSPLLMGNCTNGFTLSPIYSESIERTRQLVAISDSCTSTIKPAEIQSASLPVLVTRKSSSEDTPNTFTSALQSKWFWIGVGGFLAYQYSVNNRGTENQDRPTIRRGF